MRHGIEQLDRLAETCADHSIEGLVRHLFVDHGYQGDRVDYHDPRNSYLDEVLDRRVGMPITLSVVLLEVGRRLDLRLAGVGMPGHFLVRDLTSPDRFIDAFHAGVQLGGDACEARFRAIHGDTMPFHSSYLDAIDSRSIVMRVLNNLTVTFRSRTPRELEWLLDIRLRIPADPPDLRALAELCEYRGRFTDAAGLLDRVHDLTGNDRASQRAAQLPRPTELTPPAREPGTHGAMRADVATARGPQREYRREGRRRGLAFCRCFAARRSSPPSARRRRTRPASGR